MKSPSVYVIILNYNHIEDLKETIKSFSKQKYNNLNIIISDNGSKDGSVEWLKKNRRDIMVIENKKNLGWSEGNNMGIKYAMKKNADFILLANNDLSFRNVNIISELVKKFKINSKIGILGPSQYSYYEKDKHINSGWIIYPNSKIIFNKLRQNIIIPNLSLVDNVSGSFMMIKRKVFEDVGLIDGKLFLYGEDLDFSLRAWKKGWVSAIINKLIIYHKVSATSGKNSPLKIYYTNRNLFYLIEKHKNIHSNLSYFKFRFHIDFLKQVAKILIRTKPLPEKFQKLQSIFIAYFHGVIIKKMYKYY